VPGIVGAAQAVEVIKLLADVGTTLSNRLFIIDTLRFSARTFSL
jgi:molybdopterin/thiamine biosynthesis adenylyltransferase